MHAILKTSVAAFALAAAFVSSAHANDATGAGASFVFPAVSRWSADYRQATGKQVNYQSIGSGGGIAQIKRRPSISVRPTRRSSPRNWPRPASPSSRR